MSESRGLTRKPYTTLDRSDVSYDKLVELERRLLAATRSDRIKWAKGVNSFGDPEYEFACPAGVVDVSRAGVRVWDDRGRIQREYRYASGDGLFEAAEAWFEAMAVRVLDALIADLDKL